MVHSLLEPDRRAFLGSALGGTLALGFNVSAARQQVRTLKIARTSETRSTCPYCSVSCGVILHTLGDRAKNVTPAVVHVEGDPDHPINRGTLCPKGITLKEDIAHGQRLAHPIVRRPGAVRWEEIGWDEAITRIARHVKDTRDRSWRIVSPLLDVPRFAGRHGPEPLAGAARQRAAEDLDGARGRLLAFWEAESRNDARSADDYLSRAMLRPYLELLWAEEREASPRPRGACPGCGRSPALGILRGGAEGQGSARFLLCALCGREWAIARSLCDACGEADPARLPCFSSPDFPAVRLYACETCRRYVKTIDLSLDACQIPEVDELNSIALDPWAGTQGFARSEPGLLGL